MNAFFDQWIEILKNNELNTCSYEDFVKLCGDLSCFFSVCLELFIVIITLLVFFIIRMSQKSKTVGSRGKKQGKTMKATPKKDAKKTKDVKV